MPYEHASPLNKRFRRKGNQNMICSVKQMIDAVSLGKRHLEIVQIYYDDGGGRYWWELEAFYNKWEEIE